MARDNLDYMMVNVLSNTIKDNLYAVPEFQKANYVYGYSSFRNEVDTADIIDELLASGKRVAMPVSYTKEGIPQMDFYEINSRSDMAPGYKGILEPDRRKMSVKKATFIPNVILVPIVAFNNRMYRVGYGKGFYDYYFNMNFAGTKIGLAYGFQQDESFMPDANDVPLDIIVTEDGVFYGN